MKDELISVTSLYEESVKESKEAIAVLEREMVERWMTILTKAHISEKIKEAHTSGVQYATLVDEHFPVTVYERINTGKLFRQIQPPYALSVKDHITSMLITSDLMTLHQEDAGRVRITLYWGEALFDKLMKEDPCTSCCGCCCILTCLMCCSISICSH